MFKIGDFSRLNKISVKTLRYYDEIGLLKPVKIDEMTGYRYYSARQLPSLHRIMALKEMEFSLADIACLLNERLPAQDAAAMMQQKAAELQQEITVKKTRLERIQAWIHTMNPEEMGTNMKKMNDSFKQVVVKEADAVQVAGIRATLNDYTDQQPLWEELLDHVNTHQFSAQTPTAIYYGNDVNKEDKVQMEVAVHVNGALPETDRIRMHLLEPVREMACLIHEGDNEHLAETYAALQQWMELNGYTIGGPVREVHLVGYLTTSNTGEHITEIQIPVTRESIS